MTYILCIEEGRPSRRIHLSNEYFILRRNFAIKKFPFPNIYLKYGHSRVPAKFHVYIYRPGRKSYTEENVYPCNQYDVETDTWTGKTNFDPNGMSPLLNDESNIYLKFNFNATHTYIMPSLQDFSISTIGTHLRKHEDIQKLPIPKSLKNNFENKFLEVSKSQNSLKAWFFCSNSKDILYYFGLPNTQKQIDIHKLIHNKSVCTSSVFHHIKPEDEYIILRIPMQYYYNPQIQIINYIKKKVFKCRDYEEYNTTAKLIIISDYSPEILLDGLEEKEWILNNIYVVKKENWFPKFFIHSTPVCFDCKEYIYYEKANLFEGNFFHSRQCYIGRMIEELNSPRSNKEYLTKQIRQYLDFKYT